MSGFLVTYGPQPKVWCQSCHQPTRVVTAPNQEVTLGNVRQAEEDHEQRCAEAEGR